MRTPGVVIAGFCAFLQLYATQPLLPLLARTFGAGEVATSLTVTMGAVGVALSAPFAGRLADRLGRKRVIVWSAFLLGLATLGAATSPSLPVLIFWRFCGGVCTPGVFSIVVAYINDEWGAEEAGGGTGRVGAALSSYVSGTVMGGFSGRFLSGLIAAQLEWRWVFVILGLTGLAGALAVLILLPVERVHQPSAPTRDPIGIAVRGHFRNRVLLGTFAVGFCVLFTQVAAFTYVTFYLAAPPFNLESDALGAIFLVYPLAAGANFISGRFVDRFGHRAALTAGFVVGMAGIGLTLIRGLWAVALGLGLSSTGVFVATTTANAVVGRAAPRNRALAVGMYATFYYLGGSAGGAIPGLFWNLGGWTACVAFIAAVQLVTIGLGMAFWEPPRRLARAAD